jgi:hypothetical protein
MAKLCLNGDDVSPAGENGNGLRNKPSPAGETLGETKMTDILAANTALAGYTLKAVVSRIADMDFDAAGNAEKAAWKRYVALCLMALAKGSDKADVVKAVFGPKGKPSKTFHNAWTLANKCRGHVTGNMVWSDIVPMGIEDAFTATLGMINRQMSVLGVAGKNEWEKVCNMSLDEVTAKREADKNKTSDDTEVKTEGDNGTQEQAAQTAAADKPERSIANDAMDILANANRNEVVSVIGSLAKTLGNADLVALIGDMLESMPIEECNVIATMVANRKAAIKPVNATADVEATLEANKAKPRKLKAFSEIAA